MRQAGIKFGFTVPYSSPQNGVAEWLNLTLLNRARATLYICELPKTLWPEAVNNANLVKNCAPTCALKDVMPFEVFYGRKPNVENLEEFGAYCWVLHQV